MASNRKRWLIGLRVVIFGTSGYLPTAQAGRVAIAAGVRTVLDAAPQWVIPTKATFFAGVAQFTLKTVETEEERQKLMFRIRAHNSQSC